MSSERKNKSIKKKWLLIIAIIIVFVLDIVMFGNISYAGKWIGCGERPVLVGTVYGFKDFPDRYRIESHPGFFDEKTSIFAKGVYDISLYCAAEQARAAVPDGANIEIDQGSR